VNDLNCEELKAMFEEAIRAEANNPGIFCSTFSAEMTSTSASIKGYAWIATLAPATEQLQGSVEKPWNLVLRAFPLLKIRADERIDAALDATRQQAAIHLWDKLVEALHDYVAVTLRKPIGSDDADTHQD